MRISIALATYNGERYITEQLQSLFNQTYLPCELVVGDDCSTDATLNIIEQYREKAPFPIHIYRNEKNLGYAQNFLATAKRCQGDWIAFCDQDDVWLPNKLDNARLAIEKDQRPIMILQNAYICDEDLSHGGRLFPNRLRPDYYPPQSQYGFWVWPGFLKTVHKSMFSLPESASKPRSYFPTDGAQTHDKWTCMIANATGGFLVLPEAAALYRRHENALTGSYSSQQLRDRLAKSRTVNAEHYNFLSEVAEESSTYSQVLADDVGGPLETDFGRAARRFQRLQKVQALRASLYSSESFPGRMLFFSKILAAGGYFGPRISALGWKSMLKDLMALLGLISALNRRAQT